MKKGKKYVKKQNKIQPVQEIQDLIKGQYLEWKKWLKGSYFLVLLSTIAVISLNFVKIVNLIFKRSEVELSGFLPLFFTISIFILFIVPLMSIFTRRKCPHCHEIVSKNSRHCHKCGYDLKINK